jgi:hypothetical protein
MEVEATLHSMSNGVEKDAPSPILEQDKSGGISLSDLLAQHKELLQGLNNVKAQREATAQRLKDLETTEQRTLGALITNEQWIMKINPNALQEAEGR